MALSPTHPLTELIACLRHSAGQLGGTHALLASLLLRLLGELETIAGRWQAERPTSAAPSAPVRLRPRAPGGKGPIPRNWMLRYLPGLGLRPSTPPPPARPPLRPSRAPPAAFLSCA